MRVVHIITCLDVGGAETMLTRLLLSADQPAANQSVISLKDIGILGKKLQQHGVHVESLQMGRGSNPLIALFRLVRLLRRSAPDVVQTWMYHADFFGGIAARLAGCRHVVWGIRGTHPPIGRPWTRRLMQLCARLSYVIPQQIICVAEAARQSHSQYGYCHRKMRVIGNGLDLQHFDRLAAEPVNWQTLNGWPTDTLVLGCVGRFHPDKGQDLFVQAAAMLHQHHPALRFVMIGRGCEQSNTQLYELVRVAGLSDVLLLAGERDDVPACLRGLDFFCLPSRTEGFPNALAEAMAARVPAVASAVGDVEWLAADTVCVVPANQPPALAAAMMQLCALTPAERQQRADQARLRVEKVCSIQAVRRQYDEFYQQLLES